MSNQIYEKKSLFPGGKPTLLKPVEFKTFKGDDFLGELENLSVNEFFTIGQEYPVYYYEGMDFVVGSDGREYKITPSAWE